MKIESGLGQFVKLESNAEERKPQYTFVTSQFDYGDNGVYIVMSTKNVSRRTCRNAVEFLVALPNFSSALEKT